jgi:4a-hydroxytetrahydrobiopterin dehydratase
LRLCIILWRANGSKIREEAAMTQTQPLTQLKCVACRADSPRVTDEEVRQFHPQVREWELLEESGVRKLRRAFRFKDFAQALEFTNAIGAIAEDEGHHPLLMTEWGRVTVLWWTHKIKGLHRNDFIMAAKTDRLYSERQA